MHAHRIITTLTTYENIPMIDSEFDRFEINSDLSFSLHEADAATFYHDALDQAE